jgi:aconitase A
LQVGFENADDHLFLQSFAAKYGLYFSRPGNGICHQVHLERFAVPGQILLGADSHTPTCGGIGMVAIGVGGLDVALAMAGEPFYLKVPKVVQVKLVGRLSPWVSAKDIILEMLHRFTVDGGVGKAFEYGGPGVKTLTVPEKATIANMGAELGATTSIFPSDEMTRLFLRSQRREKDWILMSPDSDAKYDYWELHKFILSGFDDGRIHSEREDGFPKREPGHFAGFKTSFKNVGFEWGAFRSDRIRGSDFRKCMWSLYRNGASPLYEWSFPSNL